MFLRVKMSRQTLNTDKMYQDLFKRYQEVRNMNIELLEEKRKLLLRTQDEVFARDVTNNGSKQSSQRKLCGSKTYDCLKENNKEDDCLYFRDEFSCDCKSAKYLKELVQVNHKWQEKYKALASSGRENKDKFEKIQEELQQERDENNRLRTLVDKLSSDLQSLSPDIHKNVNKSETSSSLDVICYTADDIEALKQQLIAYQEDFANERKDKAKANNENQVLQEKLQEADDKIKALSDEKRRFKQCFGEVSQQKDHLISELRRLSTSTLPFSPVHQLPKSNFSASSSSQGDIIPRSSFRLSQRPNLIRASPEAFMGTKAYEG